MSRIERAQRCCDVDDLAVIEALLAPHLVLLPGPGRALMKRVQHR
ncbi:hypothetical protein [Streptomyces sp. JJ38]|nr:hypothetical protein [Streptomyces sp. JJ38]